MDDFMEEIINNRMIKLAKKMIDLGKLTLEEISGVCKLPLEKVQELAASTPAKEIQ